MTARDLLYGTGSHASLSADFVLPRRASFSTRWGILRTSPYQSFQKFSIVPSRYLEH